MRCFVPGCKIDFHGYKYVDEEPTEYSIHRFPKDLPRRMAWFQAIAAAQNREVDMDDVNRTTIRICSHHFLDSDFYDNKGRKMMHKTAIPSLFGDEAVENGKRNTWRVQEKAHRPSKTIARLRRKPMKAKKSKKNHGLNTNQLESSSSTITIKKCPGAAQQESRELINSVLSSIGALDGEKSPPSADSTVFRLEKFPHVCRLCLKPAESLSDVMVSLDVTDDVFDGMRIGEFLSDILPEGVTLDQDMQRFLPNSVCLPCLELLRFFARYRSKVTTVHLFMNSLIELKRHNSEPIVDLFNTRSSLVLPVIKDLGLSTLDDFCVQDLLDEFPRYDLSSFEGFAVKDPEDVLKQNQRKKLTQNTIYAEECTTDELMELTKISEGNPIPKEKKPPKYGGKKLDEPLQCPKCRFTTYYERNFQTHVEGHAQREARTYACKEPGCTQVFQTFPEYQSHRSVAHKSFVCDVCGHRTSRRKDLKDHVARHQMKLEHRCTYCKQGFNTKTDLGNHIRRTHLTKVRYPCETCGMTFGRKSIRDEHMVTHSDVYNFPCTLCDKKFKQRNNLRNHIAFVHEKVRLPCAYCDAQYETVYKLNNHIESVHGIQLRFVCDVCVQTFNSQDKLDKHRARHDNPHGLECGTCLSAFVSKDLVADHPCITYREDYVCCGRDLRYHYLYNKHMLTKHGLKTNARVKPVPGLLMGQMRAQRKRVESCSKCEQIFATRTLKKQHMEVCTAVAEDRNGNAEGRMAVDVLMAVATVIDPKVEVK